MKRASQIQNIAVKQAAKRITFAQQRSLVEAPDLLRVQLQAYQDFLQDGVPKEERKPLGLQQAFLTNFPITDTREIYNLEFLDYYIERPKYSEQECRERELTYARPLKAKLRLSSKADPKSEDYIETIEQDVYLGNIPAMTPRGTFIFNGAERVVVTQLHRSPGVFFSEAMHPNGTRVYSARVIPLRGSWVEFTTDIHQVMYVYIDRKKKFPATMLLRALWELDANGKPYAPFATDEAILSLFDLTETITPAQLSIEEHEGRRIAADIIDFSTGEFIVNRDTFLDAELIEKLQALDGVEEIKIYRYMVAADEPIIARTLAKDTSRTHDEALESIYRQLRSGEAPDLETARGLLDKLFFNDKRYDLGVVGRYRMNEKLQMDVDLKTSVLRVEDIIAIMKYLLDLRAGKKPVDDIDHLGNRRVRTVGEQLAQQFNVGLSRMSRTIKERLNVHDTEQLTPADLVNARTISSVVNQFFGTNQLSQFMDQTNPLAEMTHKRRMSALGPGGLTRERAGFEVRDVHYTHYGRLCPIETPEGPNIGLISSLAIHARIDEFGFIETPYMRVQNGRINTEEIVYLRADREEGKIIAPSGTPVTEDGMLAEERVKARQSGDFVVVAREMVEYMDISTQQISSVAAALIPFLEHDDANRALMGSNMQRQAVPLLRPQAPIVGTGMEWVVAQDSRAVITAEADGVVEYACADYITMRYDDLSTDDEKIVALEDNSRKTYRLTKFFRTNQDTCVNQRPIVVAGERVIKGQPLADSSSTDQGELALGRNVLVAFMPWSGYNFEDAIVISERIVAEDVFTSIHIEEYTLQVRDTKRGEEELTKEIPNVSEDATKDLDNDGLIRVGAEVREGDILIGKITPKGETDPTPEEKLLRAIFGDKAGDVKDASLKAPPGLKGVVINSHLFSRRVLTKETDMKKAERERQDSIQRRENDALADLDILVGEKLAALLDGQKVIGGIKLLDATTIFRSGTVLKSDEVLRKADGPLKLDQIMLDEDFIEDTHKMMLVRKLAANYKKKKEIIKDDFRIERQKVVSGDELQPGIMKMAKVYVAKKRKLQVGDKMAGRHGNKGIVAKIVPVEDMPFMPDGQPVDIVLNPLGVPSRMNLGQLYETALGWAGKKLGERFATPIFDGASWDEVEHYLEKAGLPKTGKTILFDGRTGDAFHNQVTVGYIYMLKLSHLVEDKIHARSIGPYSLITQQPLGGKAQFGGQRFGEMEVWALEAYGAAHTLQEILTLKSDDVQGRAKAYEAIVKGDNLPTPNIPESFNVLIRELQGLALEVKVSA